MPGSIKTCLIALQENGDIDLDSPQHKFGISWFTIRVAAVGTTLAVQSWNAHPIPGILFNLIKPGFPFTKKNKERDILMTWLGMVRNDLTTPKEALEVYFTPEVKELPPSHMTDHMVTDYL